MSETKMTISMRNSYSGMIRRTTDKESKDYIRYGERGIKVCDRWLASRKAFYEDMGIKPSLAHSLDRIDNNGDYEPSNCRWATQQEQALNRRSNHLVEMDGITKPISEWIKHFGLKSSTVHQRIGALKWPIERALREKPRIRRISN